MIHETPKNDLVFSCVREERGLLRATKVRSADQQVLLTFLI